LSATRILVIEDNPANMTLLRYADSGSWSVPFDGGRNQVQWSRVHWQSDEPTGTAVVVEVRAADDAATLSALPWLAVDNGVALADVRGRIIELQVTLLASADGRETPHLELLSVSSQEDTEPIVLSAQPSVDELWPPNHRMVPVRIAITDPAGRFVAYRITGITQDEPVASTNDNWDRLPFDAVGVGDAVAYLRATRSGDGNGRVYAVHYETIDALAGGQQGTVNVCVPHDRGRGRDCIDDGQAFDATGDMMLALKNEIPMRQYPNPFNPNTTIEYELRQPGHVRLSIFDIRGRRVRELVDQHQAPGLHAVVWDGRDGQGRQAASGVYHYQLRSHDKVVMDRMLMTK
jgi:hypothetical protein